MYMFKNTNERPVWKGQEEQNGVTKGLEVIKPGKIEISEHKDTG